MIAAEAEMDAGGACSGHPSPLGRLHHPQDATDILQVLAPASGLTLPGGCRALLKYFQAATDEELVPGVVATIQTFGDRIYLHPHAHLLVSEGGEDKDGRFHHVQSFDDGLIAEFFARDVFALLLREELISQALVEKIARLRHSGFNVHSRVKAQTKKEAERVGKYMIRPLLALERLSSHANL